MFSALAALLKRPQSEFKSALEYLHANDCLSPLVSVKLKNIFQGFFRLKTIGFIKQTGIDDNGVFVKIHQVAGKRVKAEKHADCFGHSRWNGRDKDPPAATMNNCILKTYPIIRCDIIKTTGFQESIWSCCSNSSLLYKRYLPDSRRVC